MPKPIMPHHPDSPEAKNTSCPCGGKGEGACGTKEKEQKAYSSGCNGLLSRFFYAMKCLFSRSC